jgi:regulator of ribonuclease activity A
MSLSVPDICDTFPDDVRVLEPLFRNYGGRLKFSGEIVTVECHEDNSLVKETIRTEGRGRIIVVDGGASMRCALLGDMLAAMALDNGWSGLLIFGCVRDVEIVSTIDIGVRALNCHPRKSEKRGQGQLDVSVSFAGVTIAPGDYLYADENGIVVTHRNLDIEF